MSPKMKEKTIDGFDSVETSPDHSEIDLQFERRLIRKMDLRVCPWVMLVYLVSFLDRVNIGNARLFGLEADLGMAGSQYQTAVSVLFVTYLLFEVPSNLVIKKLRPSRYGKFAFITFAWGIVATLTGIVQSYGGLIACRLILGLFEAGLFPGMAVYLTFWYTRKELALRIGYLFVSSALAGAFGGLLATAIGQMDGVAGQRGWRWIIIIEQVMFPAYGSRESLVIPFVLPDSPDTAPWLTPAEKAYIRARKLRQQGETADAQKFHWSDVRKCFMDPKVYAFAAAQFGFGQMERYANSTLPCYSGAITYLVIAFLSDRYQIRGWFCVAGGAVSVLGYIILLVPVSSGVHYMGCFFVAMGLYVVVGIPLSWLPNNIPRYGKRTSATGFQLMIGNASGVMAPFLYATNEKPRYIRGHAVSLAMVAFASAVYAVLAVVYSRINARRSTGKEDYKLAGKTDEEVDAMGDESPRFRWVPSFDCLGETK
ncbi:major facilitator superfamily transporter [Rhizoctonia solani]|uniref:Major facilitator superfamily transporter n=1 Tax=Rhizoctonia solani TaxID=456999 RepID=A0A8H8P365_9AGAM|nr:major facilitator superfamily transporter [Rhizoctonia solani]QRW22802.1 major facilitator superfamily transporter [Rhizoctonia solani]